MVNGGLLRDPGRILHDEEFQRSFAINVALMIIILILSAFYHFYLKPTSRTEKDGVKDEDIAEIDSLIVYPVKSGRGIELDDAMVSRKGFKFDRRWAVIAKKGLKRLNLKEEPKITHIIPSFDYDNNMLKLRIGKESQIQLPEIAVPLEIDQKTLQTWPHVQNVSFYGDFADGRESQLAPGEWKWKGTPSEWVTELLGYPVHFLQFDPVSSKRIAFPIFKPPHDLSRWENDRQKQLKSVTGVEFQDLYPFLIATRESLAEVNEHVQKAIKDEKFRYDKTFWSRSDQDVSLPIQRFRPNIVLRSRKSSDGNQQNELYPAFSEDSWETIWVKSDKGTLPIHLVTRCERCLLTTVDPETAHRDPNVPLAILRETRSRISQPGIKKRPSPCFGMYSIPEEPSNGFVRIKVGDPVRVRWRPYALDDEVEAGRRTIRQVAPISGHKNGQGKT